MSTWTALLLIVLAAGLLFAGRYNWIPKGFPKAIAQVAALFIVIVALAIVISPFRELGK
jgi:hypothetical protein